MPNKPSKNNQRAFVNTQAIALKKGNAADIAATRNKARSGRKPLGLQLKMAGMLCLFSFLVYTNTLSNDYAMDDIEILQNNSFVLKGIKGIPEILSTPHLRGFMIAPNETYRPLSLVAFAVEYQLWGANPTVNHFFNVLTFIAGIAMLFFFIDSLFDKKKTAVAFAAALLFAVHPIHTEVVANIKSRDELLCFFFGMLSLNLFIKYMKRANTRHLLAGMGALFLSLISKETDITFLGIVPVIFFFYKNDSKKRATLITAGTVLIAVSFLVLRAYVLHINNNTLSSINMIDNELAKAPSYSVRLATAVYTMGLYLKLLMIPHPLISDYSYNTIPFVGFSNPWVILSIAAYVSLIGVGFYRLFKHKKDPWAFCILFFLICLSLFTNITFLIGSGMGERFLFCASAGFCLAAALGLEKLAGGALSLAQLRSKKIAIVFVPVLLAFSGLTYARNAEWKDNSTLYTADLAKAPNSSRLNYCVGYVMVSEQYKAETNPAERQKLLERGIGYLQRSISIFPEYGSAQIEIGNAYFMNKQYDSAEVHDRMALKINPQASEAMNNIAGVYFVTHKLPQAIEMCKEAIKVRPSYAEAYYNIGLCFNNMRQYDSSIAYLNTALKVDPGYKKAYTTLASSYQGLNKPDSVNKYVALMKMSERAE